ncbi:MAG TPA: hypothetical protein VEL75_07950 [Candidatus Methylomirabilis sp.]|nr:hypothetical protein [Candidatus Methylomirabilis sp.]
MDRTIRERSILAGVRPIGGRLCGLRAAAVAVLLPVLIGIPAPAFAEPPDPVWIPGVYDAADWDDVVARVAGTDATGGGVLPEPTGSTRVLVGTVAPAAESVVPSTAAFVLGSRSPPLG